MQDKGEKRILVVDDSYESRSSLIKLLLDQGYKHFEQASSGSEAFVVLKHRPIDLIISQWDMPQMSGLALLQVLSVDIELYKTPFILISPNITKAMVLEAGIRGVAAIFQEPLDPGHLDKKIVDVLYGPQDELQKRFEMLFAEAVRLTNEGMFDEALNLYSKLLKIREVAEIHYNVGFIKIAQGEHDAAFSAFRKAQIISNFHAQSYKKMGNIHLLKGNKHEAEKCFKNAKEHLVKLENEKELVKSLEEAIDLERSESDLVVDENVFNNLGIVYRRKKKYQEAIKHYTMAIKISPDDENIYFNLARALLDNKQPAEAKEMLEHALSINPKLDVAIRLKDSIGARL